MFAAALSLALGVLSPALPAAAVTSGATVTVCFSPEKDCLAFAVDPIDRTESQILVITDSLTTGSGIVEAKYRGVDVKLIADRTTPCERASGRSYGQFHRSRPCPHQSPQATDR